MNIKILADQNIPFAVEAFSSLGSVELVSADQITPERVRDAQILLVRSTTTVDQALVEGSSLRFVATATIGTDHVDCEYLESKSIGFASAPGSNAVSVVEYILTALYLVAEERGVAVQTLTLGIVGVGEIGSRLALRAKSLGLSVLLCDPFRASEGISVFAPLEKVVAGADVLTVHVPLTYEGKHPTYGMINDQFLSLMKKNAVLINASRGKVTVEEALLAHQNRLAPYILDVWPQEPEINGQLLKKCFLATPHIAGYSFDGKCVGTEMIYQAACAFFFAPKMWSATEQVFSFFPSLTIPWKGSVLAVLLAAYNIQEDDSNFREIQTLTNSRKRQAFFTNMRKNYPKRYEFCNYVVEGIDSIFAKEELKNLGFSFTKRR